ncbi:DUF916 and DUF3324 domain-containing protein [Enterococcus sp. HY326]|uniref:DUF916 and DUF3324 domain-containing protein n=1 Tax=Enterococcus sp. HY326 TaxID=2971265 RepID=UPI00223F017F|nr:DUF916 and DUF3324 domain-containing protein [Enterococcus sp. HY326]
MNRKNFFLLLGFLTILFTPFIRAQAVENNEVDYSIKAIIPENQVNKDLSYFDLRVEPGANQTIEVQVNNFSDKAEKYSVEVNTAQTNGNLLIDYNSITLPENSINSVPISELIDYPEEVEIPPQKAGIISFEIKVPDEPFTGILLGGIHIKKDFSDESSDDTGKIKSEYDYILGLRLSENDESVTPNIEFSTVAASNISNNAGVTVQLKNPTATTIKGVSMTGNIYLGDSDTPVISREIENGSIAPQSIFDLFFFNGQTGGTQPLEAGDYHLEMEIRDNADNHWEFNEAFKISAREAQKVNNQIFTTEQDNTMLYIVIGILCALVVGLLIIWFIKKEQKRRQKEKRKVQKAKTQKSKKRKKE